MLHGSSRLTRCSCGGLASASDAASGDWSVIARDDGSKQWAYKGKPLNYWVKDQKAGDRTGDGFNKVWQLAKP